MLDNLAKHSDHILQLIYSFAPKVLGALAVLVIGLIIVKRLTVIIQLLMKKNNVDNTLQGFLTSLISTVLKLLLILSVAGIIGIQLTSFIAIFSAAAFAIGMALSGTLQNFAGGVMILLFRPFETGHVIEAAGFKGSVDEIHIFNTILKTPDNTKIIVPNSAVSSSAIVNFSCETTRRVDFEIGIAYSDNLDLAKTTLEKIITSETRILKDPAHQIALKSLGDSSVNLTVRVWVNTSDYWGVYFDVLETIKKTFDETGLNFPFPQRDVNLINSTGTK